jgi:hypothetical protein
MSVVDVPDPNFMAPQSIGTEGALLLGVDDEPTIRIFARRGCCRISNCRAPSVPTEFRLSKSWNLINELIY